ncbi:MAG: glycosyl transferase family 1 [Acidimicrobiaceae bacterium]|nr:glycosyl transferase family 1 [Acidimicrobiaceae bacterium]
MITTEMTAFVCMAGGILTSTGGVRNLAWPPRAGGWGLGSRGRKGSERGAIMQFDDDTQPPQTPVDQGRWSSTKIGDLAADAGIGRIHVLAWRDLDDVEAGGSELHASTVAARWAAAGIEVVMRTSHAAGSPPRAIRNGYEIVRYAGRYLIFPRAVAAELFGRHGRRDALVEIWNGVPFLSPLWARGHRATWLHHVHEDMWPMVLPPKLARAGQLLERRFAPPFYRRTPIVTLSESSRAHILDRLRLPADNVHVVPPGIDPGFSPGAEAPDPTVVAVGRLMPSKNFPALLDAMAAVRRKVPNARLRIIGEGYERPNLERRIAQLGAAEWCTLEGRVAPEVLLEAYRSAWIVASTSRAEGWGMTLTEAAACATPAVATRIPGHTDAVVDNVTGLLVDRNDELAPAMVRLLTDHDVRQRQAAAALTRSAHFSWDRTAFDTLAVLAGHPRS